MHYHALQGRGLNHIESHVSNMTTDNSNNNNNFSFFSYVKIQGKSWDINEIHACRHLITVLQQAISMIPSYYVLDCD